LSTQDPVDKVVEYYKSKLNPVKVIKIPGANVVLESPSVKAIITSSGDGANILLTSEVD
jgi:hypothetical protein